MSGMDSLKSNVRKGLLGAGISAVGAGVGGLIAGPIGMAVGGTVGGVIAATVFDFRSAPEVIENDFTPNERQDLLDRGRRAVIDFKELVVKIILQMLREIRNCKTFEDFKHHILLPLLIELVGQGARELIRLIFATIF